MKLSGDSTKFIATSVNLQANICREALYNYRVLDGHVPRLASARRLKQSEKPARSGR